MANAVEPKPKPEKQEYVYLRDRMDLYGRVLGYVTNLQYIDSLTDVVVLALQKLKLLKSRKS